MMSAAPHTGSLLCKLQHAVCHEPIGRGNGAVENARLTEMSDGLDALKSQLCSICFSVGLDRHQVRHQISHRLRDKDGLSIGELHRYIRNPLEIRPEDRHRGPVAHKWVCPIDTLENPLQWKCTIISAGKRGEVDRLQNKRRGQWTLPLGIGTVTTCAMRLVQRATLVSILRWQGRCRKAQRDKAGSGSSHGISPSV